MIYDIYIHIFNHQHVSVTPVAIISVLQQEYNSYTNNCTKMYDKTTWLQFIFYVASLKVIKYHMMLSHNFNYVAGCESTIHNY